MRALQKELFLSSLIRFQLLTLKEICEAPYRFTAFLGGQVIILGRLKFHRVSPFVKSRDKGNGSLQGRCLIELLVFVFEGKHLGTDGSWRMRLP